MKRKVIQILIAAICIGCIIAGIVLCILEFLKVGIAAIFIGAFGSTLLYCDWRTRGPEPDVPLTAVVVIKEEGRSKQ